ncbi:MAG: 4'-phosphopantetheinyl transferase superfamily protein [bacterium]
MDLASLNPVIIPVLHPAPDRLSGREKNALLQRTARQALFISAQRSGVTLGPLIKDERGAPVPTNGVYWSLSHKTYCVAAVVSGEKIGIDIEEIRPRKSRDLFSCLADQDEWRLVPDPDWDLFFRYWTAKEAATKATGVGLKDFKICKVVAIPDERHLVLDYAHRLWHIEHYWYQNHIISVVADGRHIRWSPGIEGG